MTGIVNLYYGLPDRHFIYSSMVSQINQHYHDNYLVNDYNLLVYH